MDTTTIEDDNDLTLHNVIYGGSSQDHCIICLKERDHLSDMITMPKLARFDLLIIHKLYVSHGVRCCRKHLLSSSRLGPEEIINMDSRQQLKVALLTEEPVDLIDNLLNLIEEAIRSPRLDFCDPLLSNEDYEAWTGWEKDRFQCMLEEVTVTLPHRLIRCKQQNTTIHDDGSHTSTDLTISFRLTPRSVFVYHHANCHNLKEIWSVSLTIVV